MDLAARLGRIGPELQPCSGPIPIGGVEVPDWGWLLLAVIGFVSFVYIALSDHGDGNE